MRVYGKLGLYLSMVAMVFALSACGEDTKNTPDTQNTQPPENISQTGVLECDQYLDAMFLCASTAKDSQEQATLVSALSDLKQRMLQTDDKEHLRQICQLSLENLEDQKKLMGCVN